jgi:hypothetical protein
MSNHNALRLSGPEIAEAAAKTDYGKVDPLNREMRRSDYEFTWTKGRRTGQ